MKTEDIEFLKSLKNELKTQRQMAPDRGVYHWAIAGRVKRVCNKKNACAWVIFDGEGRAIGENCKEVYDNLEKYYDCEILDEEAEAETKGMLKSAVKRNDEVDMVSIINTNEFLEKDVELVYYHWTLEYLNTVFLTKKECDTYIREESKYIYLDSPRSCRIKAKFGLDFDKLMEIVEKTEWGKE